MLSFLSGAKSDSQGRKTESALYGSSSGDVDHQCMSEESFARMLCLERRRSERSRKPFLLMLVDAEELFQTAERDEILTKILFALRSSTRETDIRGWHRDNSVLGTIFTEFNAGERGSMQEVLLFKVRTALHQRLSPEEFNRIQISLHPFPEDWDTEGPAQPINPQLYPDLSRKQDSRRLARFLKRAMDIVGSVLALIFFSPLYFAISLAIKLSSQGPVLLHQERIGQHGVPFTLLKFRTMKVLCDAEIHKQYVKEFISRAADPREAQRSQDAVYKITGDPRVTTVGRFLRKTSLDELPQFWNVLRGEMSLVGPRPPIAYEVESYKTWHKRRVLETKPGITGLWQVKGRSRTSFDDMVRLDLKYAEMWSLWLDIKILLQTPRAVISCKGAY